MRGRKPDAVLIGSDGFTWRRLANSSGIPEKIKKDIVPIIAEQDEAPDNATWSIPATYPSDPPESPGTSRQVGTKEKSDRSQPR
ncbi:MAG TPA: hypothetical protein VGB30_08665 [bacterium]